MKKISLKLVLTLVSIVTSTGLSANAQHTDKFCGAHTWHNIFVNEGEWNASLQVINETEHAWFVGLDCSKVNSLTVRPNNVQKYGFAFDGTADFDVAYSLTLTQQSDSLISHFRSKACVFIVTADGPAQPNITAKSYNGAKCNWKVVPGVGEDFYAG